MKLTFLEIKEKFMVTKSIENLPEMSEVITRGLAKNEDVIKINNHKLADERFQYFFHKVHKSDEGIAQTERHDLLFVKAFTCLESSLPLIPKA